MRLLIFFRHQRIDNKHRWNRRMGAGAAIYVISKWVSQAPKKHLVWKKKSIEIYLVDFFWGGSKTICRAHVSENKTPFGMIFWKLGVMAFGCLK